MKKLRNILLTLVLLAFVAVLGGCSGSADSLMEASIKLLPKARIYTGKNAEEVEGEAIAATTARAAMESEVANTATDVATIMNAFNPPN